MPGLASACLLLTGATLAVADPAAPRFAEAGPIASNEGHAVLQWQPVDGAATYELQQSDDAGFSAPRERYEGRQLSFFATGLEQGDHYFRVRAVDATGAAGPWSAARAVEVRYPDRGRVVWLLAMGGGVFLATVAAILIGFRSRRGS